MKKWCAHSHTGHQEWLCAPQTLDLQPPGSAIQQLSRARNGPASSSEAPESIRLEQGGSDVLCRHIRAFAHIQWHLDLHVGPTLGGHSSLILHGAFEHQEESLWVVWVALHQTDPFGHSQTHAFSIQQTLGCLQSATPWAECWGSEGEQRPNTARHSLPPWSFSSTEGGRSLKI